MEDEIGSHQQHIFFAPSSLPESSFEELNCCKQKLAEGFIPQIENNTHVNWKSIEPVSFQFDTTYPTTFGNNLNLLDLSLRANDSSQSLTHTDHSSQNSINLRTLVGKVEKFLQEDINRLEQPEKWAYQQVKPIILKIVSNFLSHFLNSIHHFV